MKINYLGYNYSNYKQNFYNNKAANNLNKGISFNGNNLYMEHLTKGELGLLSNYATTLKGNKIPTKLMIGPTFDTVEKVMKLGAPFNSLQEFLQLALRAEGEITNKMILKAKLLSCICAEKYPKEHYANEVNKVLNQIETSEPIILENMSANPLWGYANVLQRQADWISVYQAIIKECEEREKTVDLKIQTLDEKFTKELVNMREDIARERQERLDAINRLSHSIGSMQDFVHSYYKCDPPAPYKTGMG